MPQPGDVFEINTARGEAYVQFMQKNKLMGSAIRVLPGTYVGGNSDIESLVRTDAGYWIFFPLSAALKAKVVRRVGAFEIPSHSKKLPLFRSGVVDPATGRIENWWLWDGENSRMVGAITDEQRRLPIKSIWNDTLLVERIEQGWSPEKHGG
ncbi:MULTISPECIES: hypothetical protein [unclassified Rhizobium]|uniref:hypothetical protein n=1 Tax=unclassified Rhizobium TaxID=2613769 RepID=UPI001AD9DB8C|nr:MULTISPECIES: hypothetical protein [unclassified Rhizobium]MBO9123004.1 hypothetical protein [Rhizobium sp. 16-488-2b]MBO9173536.1 hypothetical protein [Rhizobium sp. 16-488-2a]